MNFSRNYFSRANNVNTHTTWYHIVEVKHKSLYLGNNLLFVHQTQQVYYLSYPHESMKHWWVMYKVNSKMDIHRYDAYMERHDDDDVVHVYQEENEGDQGLCFTVSDGAGLTKLVTRDVELMEDEPGPSKKRLKKSKQLVEKQERRE
jgi:hypothetical protein